jgi:hypothetical protein
MAKKQEPRDVTRDPERDGERVTPPAAPVMVRAKVQGQASIWGFYRGQRVRPGMTFRLEKPEDFNPATMEPAPAGAPDQLAPAGSGEIKAPGGAPERPPRPEGSDDKKGPLDVI